ncbi:MAG TPA: hypothetical protein VFY06_05115 [Verrucomicrobiae bacterium]|nr:hypothetical protein [Verrucomicrobiae bacterium]
MPDYLWTGKDKFGKPITEHVSAETITQARMSLEERGYTDLCLHTDDVSEITKSWFEGKEPKLSASDHLRWVMISTRQARMIILICGPASASAAGESKSFLRWGLTQAWKQPMSILIW